MSPRVLFEQDLELLKNKVTEMGEHAEISYDRMLYGIRENKGDLLKTLLDTDHTMVDMQRSIEAMCLSLLTRQQPVARDMRLVSASLKVVTDIERIGDHVADMVEHKCRRKTGKTASGNDGRGKEYDPQFRGGFCGRRRGKRQTSCGA